MIVVDTNVVSELMKPTPHPMVREWALALVDRDLFTTSITVAEVRYGIERLPHGRRQDVFRATADDIFAAFHERILPFDTDAALQYASIVTNREADGSPIDGFDAQIAAICSVHRAMLATRNVKDFRGTGVAVIDPWQASTT